jgi:hypothetical protein
MEPTAPSYLCETTAEFEEALLLLGAAPRLKGPQAA